MQREDVSLKRVSQPDTSNEELASLGGPRDDRRCAAAQRAEASEAQCLSLAVGAVWRNRDRNIDMTSSERTSRPRAALPDQGTLAGIPAPARIWALGADS